MTGAKLAALVCNHMRAGFRLRRRLLKNNVEYSERSRDPPPCMDGDDVGLAPTGFNAMGRTELQRLCRQKRFKANGTTESMIAALEASLCSDMAATGGGSAAEDGGDGMVLNLTLLNLKELQHLCKQKKLKANVTSVEMRAALEASRCSAMAGSAAEDDDEDVEDDED